MKINVKKIFLLVFACLLIIPLWMELTHNPNQFVCDNIGTRSSYNKKLKNLDENLTMVKYLSLYNKSCKEFNQKDDDLLSKAYNKIIIKWENSNDLKKLNSAYNYLYYGLKDT